MFVLVLQKLMTNNVACALSSIKKAAFNCIGENYAYDTCCKARILVSLSNVLDDEALKTSGLLIYWSLSTCILYDGKFMWSLCAYVQLIHQEKHLFELQAKVTFSFQEALVSFERMIDS